MSERRARPSGGRIPLGGSGRTERRRQGRGGATVTTAGLMSAQIEQTVSTQEFIAQAVENVGPTDLERGDTAFLDGTVTDGQGAPFDLSGCKLWHTAKRNIEDDDIDAIFQLTSETGEGITITDAPGGAYEIHILPEDTEGLTQDETLIFDVQVRTSEGHIYTVTEGVYNVSRDITRSTT